VPKKSSRLSTAEQPWRGFLTWPENVAVPAAHEFTAGTGLSKSKRDFEILVLLLEVHRSSSRSEA
jgi:hypothetical protein